MHPASTSVALVAYSSTSDVAGKYRTWVLGNRAWDTWKQDLGSDVRRPPSGGAGVGLGPVIVVAVMWS